MKPLKKKKPPELKCRRWSYDILQSTWFDLLMIVIIAIKTAVIAMIYDKISKSYERFIEVMNYIFIFIYNVEFIVKIIGIGKQYSTYSSWNTFDFVCVCISDLAIVLIIFGIDGLIKTLSYS